jgi:hypothetical protein
MAKKRDIRQRAFDALGDFSGYVGEDVIRDKMVQIFKDEARAAGIDDTSVSMAAAIIARDGNLKALGKERIEDFYLDVKPKGKAAGWDGEADHAGMKKITQVMDDIKRDVAANGKKKAKAKATITPEKKAHFEELIAAEKERAAKAKAKSGLDADGLPVVESSPVSSSLDGAKRKKGRPRKHDSGGQISVWFDDETKARIERIMKRSPRNESFSDVVNGLIKAGLKYLGEDK